MRQGLRSSGPVAPGLTRFVTRNQMFGGEPEWAVTPYLANGADPLTQNNIGNVHSQNGSGASTSSVNGMAISALGDMTANVRVRCNATFSGSGTARTMVVNSISVGDGLLLSGAGTARRLRIRYVGQGASAREIWITAQTVEAVPGTPGSLGTYSVSAAAAGDFTNGTFDISALSPLTSADGGPAVGIVDTGGKKYYRMRVSFDDQNSAGQSGRKVLIRIGDAGTAPADGQGAQAMMGQTRIYAFSLRVPAATRAYFSNDPTIGQWLIWQHHNGGPGPCLSIYAVHGDYRDNYSTPPGYGTGPSLLMKLSPGAPQSQIRLVDNYAADTWMHFVMRVTFGVSQWVTGKNYGSGEFVHNAGNIYFRDAAGAPDQTSGVTAPTHGSGTVSDGLVSWTWLKVTPATNVEPKTQVWRSINGVQSPAATPAANYSGANARSNMHASAPDLISAYWGWYGPSYGGAGNNNWASGDALEQHWSEVTVPTDVIAGQAVTDVALNQWFSALRDRVPA